MQRRVSGDEIRELVGRLRERIPNLVLRTTFITGFPGETESQFGELKEFVKETRFERMGVFPYSLEPGTPAVRLDGHLPDDVRLQWYDELMAVQQPIAFQHAASLVGFEVDVLIDEQLQDGVWAGRCWADAPEIDAGVFVTGNDICPGEIVPVEIVRRENYDLVGVAVEDPDSQLQASG